MATEVLAPLPAAGQEQPQQLGTEQSGESADGAVNVVAPAEAGKAAGEQQQEPPFVPRGIYFVRCPRPELSGGDAIAKLDLELSACFTKLKALNNKFNLKKGEANELRRQLSVARSLRNGSSPEFDEKMTRLKQLRDLRKSYLDKLSDHKAGRAGLDCRTEEELDERIAEIEHAIQHEGLSLADEKAKVKQIAKLKSQREKIREFQGATEGLGQVEAEARKLKAVIDEVEGEVNILRGERSEAKDIIDELSKKLAVVTGALDEYSAERQEIEGAKRSLQERLKALRDEADSAMHEFRANRKLGLTIRDLVADGKAEEAKALAAEQVDAYLTKLQSDKAFRAEYTKLWADQRKYLVSELLPNSGNVQGGAPAAAAGGKGKGGKAAAAPLVPQGKARAEALIAAALQEASAVIAAQRAAEPQRQPEQEPEPSSDEAGDEGGEGAAPAPPARRIVPGAPDELVAVRKPTKAAKAAASAGSVDVNKPSAELPELPQYEYAIPEIRSAREAEGGLSAEQQKAKLREQQRRLAEEAEERKKRRQEAAAKKTAARQRAAAEAAAAAAKAAKAANRAAALAAAAVAEEADAAAATTDTEGAGDDADGAGPVAAAASSSHHHHHRGGKGGRKASAGVAPSSGAGLRKPGLKKAPKVLQWYEQIWQQYQGQLVAAVVALLTLLLVLAWVTTPK